jgi:hypothetical protein
MQDIRSKIFFRVQSAVEIHVGFDSADQTVQTCDLFQVVLGLEIAPQANVHPLSLL